MLSIRVVEGAYGEGTKLTDESHLSEAPESITVIFTNNGDKPEGEIVEKGGLASLRSIVEGAGGSMMIDVTEQFEL